MAHIFNRLAGLLGYQRIDTTPTRQKATTYYTPESAYLAGLSLDEINSVFGISNISSAYNNSWVAYACIRRQARDAGGVPILVLRDPDDTESLVQPAHPTRRLFERPHPALSTSDVIQWMVTWALLRGEFFMVFDDPFSPTRMIPYTDPRYWRTVLAGDELLAWEYRHGAEYLMQAPEELVHYKDPNPGDPWRGQSPLQAASNPYLIETGADELQADIIRRGGERSILYTAESDTTEPQRQQALAQLRARRQRGSRVPRDVILPNSIKPVDPRFIEEDAALLNAQAPAADKICAIYGMSRSLLGIEDIDKYATFKGRAKIYWHNQLLPMLHAIEDSFDRFFYDEATANRRAYVRFDTSDVPALQEDLGEMFTIAGNAHDKGIPWTVLNDRFQLGLDVDAIPGAETVLVQSILAPIEAIIEGWSGDLGPAEPGVAEVAAGDELRDLLQKARDTAADESSALKRQAEIERKARDPRRVIQRNRRMEEMRAKFRREWKKLLSNYAKRAVAAAEAAAPTVESQRAALKKSLDGIGTDMAELVRPFHEKSAVEGALSIVELVGKVDHEDREAFKRTPAYRPEVAEWIDERENLIKGLGDEDLFADLIDRVKRVVIDGEGAPEIAVAIKHGMQVEANRALMISRTEIGSAYSVSRFHETKYQGFAKTKWITANDTEVRLSHKKNEGVVRNVGSKFPNGMQYPMQAGFPAGEVINCRCETIPYVEGA